MDKGKEFGITMNDERIQYNGTQMTQMIMISTDKISKNPVSPDLQSVLALCLIYT